MLIGLTVRYRISIISLLGAFAMQACIIDTVPLPDFDDREEDRDGLDPSFEAGAINASALYYTESPVLLVGVEWAVPASIDVVAANPIRQNWRGTTEASASGSFNMPVNAVIGDLIEISIYLDGEEIDAVPLLLAPASSAAERANGDLDAFLGQSGGNDPPTPGAAVVVSPPTAQGVVTISAPAGTVSPGIAIVVANLANGASTVTNAQNDGSFLARLSGQSGDPLSIFAVEPAASNAGAAPLTAFVP